MDGIILVSLDGSSIRALFYAALRAKRSLADDGLTGEQLARMQARYEALAEAYAYTVGADSSADPSVFTTGFDLLWWEDERGVREQLKLLERLDGQQQAAETR